MSNSAPMGKKGEKKALAGRAIANETDQTPNHRACGDAKFEKKAA